MTETGASQLTDTVNKGLDETTETEASQLTDTVNSGLEETTETIPSETKPSETRSSRLDDPDFTNLIQPFVAHAMAFLDNPVDANGNTITLSDEVRKRISDDIVRQVTECPKIDVDPNGLPLPDAERCRNCLPKFNSGQLTAEGYANCCVTCIP